MPQTQTLILAIGALQGFLLFVLLVSDKRVNYASKILGVQCLFIATTFSLPLIVEAENSYFTWLIAPLVFLPACYGGLTYLYCRTALTGLPLKPLDFLHLIPLSLCYLINYNVLFSPSDALHFVRLPDEALLIKMITKTVIFGQIIVYTALTIRMVKYYHTKAKQTLSSYNPDIFKWLWGLIIFTVSFWSLSIFFNFVSRVHGVNTLAYLLLVLMVYFIALAQWRNPSLFHIEQLAAEPEATTNRKPSDGLIDKETRSSILQIVQEKVEEQNLYRNSELTLASLAEEVGVSPHYLSETLNQHSGKNFNQFINEYRVAEVCEQLKQENKSKLIDLALDAGFSSKSSFNAIFKKLTGKTPSQHRQSLTNQT
ncbi:hypothetical protein NBRC116583_11960 [Arenicella sp. 4NH20-0111]|uniref:helix-turn-helix domain-containing protein n=1 Tax=Arenicella sp. 4NH20-0111 TaxID=3127648 RepID=UPI0031021915